MTRVNVQEPSGPIGEHAREYALLHQLQAFEPSQKGIDAKNLLRYVDRGNEAKVKELAGKPDVSFEDFAEAFKKRGSAAAGQHKGNCVAWAAKDESGVMAPWKFNRRSLRPDDVRIQVTYVGMCHSDLHQIRDDWGGSKFPMVPGHECLGVVTEVGPEVKKFKVGDLAAVGCMVDSCGQCPRCKLDEEQYCDTGMTPTYNGKYKDGEVTQGGYSTFMVVKESFTLKLEKNMHKAATAPLLCAGITVYSPMRFYGMDKEGMRIGVNGIGGLGHMAVKFGKAFGCHVTALSRSDKKHSFAFEKLGVDDFLATSNAEAMKKAAESFDAIIDTVSAHHDINAILSLLKVDGKLVCVGVPSEPYALAPAGFVMRRRQIGGSLIGGIKETQEMLDYCAEKELFCDVEVVTADYINHAFKRMEAGDVHFRFVIDNLRSILPDAA